MPSVEACEHCAGRVEHRGQRTCPHCLEPLETRTFGSEAALERFREDRRAHGADVPVEEDDSSTALGLVFSAIAVIMIVAGAGIAYSGLASGSFPEAARAIGQAVMPLAMGAGFFVMARRYGGS